MVREVGAKPRDELQRSHDLAAVESTLTHTPPTVGYWLQRSHDLAAVESVVHRENQGAGGLASTEPRPRGRGEHSSVKRCCSSWLPLQRSHDLAAVERKWTHEMGAAARQASTEPRPRGRGEFLAEVGPPHEGQSFNGATTSRPWRAPPAPNTASPRYCFNGATTSRPWRERTCPGPAPTAPCFNGATTSRPWRDIPDYTHASQQGAASTEPRPRGRGETTNTPCSPPRSPASTEPRPRGRGEIEETDAPGKKGRLQRSHDLAAVERRMKAIGYRVRIQLQRSHDLAAVERRWTPSWPSAASTRFNGATTSRPWRGGRWAVSGRGEQHASTEPRPRGRGELHGLRGARTQGGASTEPRPRGRGETTVLVNRDVVVELQRSHDLAAVESAPRVRRVSRTS